MPLNDLCGTTLSGAPTHEGNCVHRGMPAQLHDLYVVHVGWLVLTLQLLLVPYML